MTFIFTVSTSVYLFNQLYEVWTYVAEIYGDSKD
jgi:hypothetical protein